MCSESVVQAVKTARASAFKYYLGVALAAIFFGGFFFKSYWDEHTFNRDTEKLLAYYKHVLPDSISDGDIHNARHIVWKHRSNRKRLWEKLEKKYGVPMREANEWEEDEDVGGGAADEEEAEDIDGDNEAEPDDATVEEEL